MSVHPYEAQHELFLKLRDVLNTDATDEVDALDRETCNRKMSSDNWTALHFFAMHGSGDQILVDLDVMTCCKNNNIGKHCVGL